ncbi:hypothetical protein BWQ96_07374 [Gracilariopsis chorda]|uniref:Uncharacterized protein n=1 Tax=Gracilariopsis chorda TaxID=448386 RepID=A0A2V3ILK2_9FLOR|nr:hypothetical protein BWQ96_07374 [Gracilariopsis chorda]|eukprot:PXF42927.1 hypothetical protein BWQ96_07374 [Gracilariopsis chorda]
MACSDKQTAIDDLSGLGNILKTIAKNGEVGGATLEEINARCFCAVSVDLGESLSSVQAIIVDGLDKAKRIAHNIRGLPTAVGKEVEDLPDILKLTSISYITSTVWELLAHFQAAAEDPVRLYPRLVCGSIPMDPAKVTKFTKQYRVLERLNDANDQIPCGDKSMSVPPKSSHEVVAKIQSSAETLSEAVLDVASQMSGLEKEFADLKESTKTLLEVQRPIDDILDQQEEVYGMSRKLHAIFSVTKTEDIDGERDFDQARCGGVIDMVEECSTVLEGIGRSQSSVQDAIMKIQSLGGLCRQQAETIRTRIEKVEAFLNKLVIVLKKLLANIPRLMQELRHFFVPSGWRACVLTPSQDLLTMFGEIERLKEALPDPDSLQESSSRGLAEGDLVGKLNKMKDHVEELARIPSMVLKKVEEEDLQRKVVESVRRILLRITEELTESTTEEIIDNIGERFGVDDITEKVEQFFPLGKSGSRSDSTGGNDGALPGLRSNMTASGIFKAIF